MKVGGLNSCSIAVLPRGGNDQSLTVNVVFLYRLNALY